MSRIPMLDNILAQPASHRGLLTLHQGNATLRACAKKSAQPRGGLSSAAWGARCSPSCPR